MRRSALFLLVVALILGGFTYRDLQPVPATLKLTGSTVEKPQLLDRHLNPITITYKNHWNLHDIIALHQVPEFLQRAFILAEDKRFYEHQGVDFLALIHAFWQNTLAQENIRGASTISEQTIKMLHKRPRTIWSRWLRAIEAIQLEKRFSKIEILEFYLNQVPYSAQRRGVVQAARYYFHRDLDTLKKTEQMLLAVLVRAPSRLDPIKHPDAAKPALVRLAKAMLEPLPPLKKQSGYAPLSRPDNNHLSRESTAINKDSKNLYSLVNASHFAKYIYTHATQSKTKIQTTLDLNLQTKTSKILEQRIDDLKKHNVQNGAVLIVDHTKNEIISWVVAGDGNPDYKGAAIDAVTTPRQPGSTLKPLLYTLALERGFTAASLIDDSPLRESVGVGQHAYQNYSRQHYGLLSLREALGNSLNIPAVKTLQIIGTENFLTTLKQLGIYSLKNHPDLYGDGLALGNGEVTLYELVQAYTTLARHGNFKPLVTHQKKESALYSKKKIFSAESSSLIANILSDPKARKREFGTGGLLHFPIQTAVKTGTSNDYRDAWAIGFNHHYTVGVWMGNMNRKSMNRITGSRGPALVLRSIFSELNKSKKPKALYLSPKLIKTEVCKETGLPTRSNNKNCSPVHEWFLEKTAPSNHLNHPVQHVIRILQPSPNLQLAMDPRIPDQLESFQFSINQTTRHHKVKWYLNDQLLAETSNANYQWSLQPGQHRLYAEVVQNERIIETTVVSFLVK